ncbi:MAG: hypothetical protein CM15mP114_14520 [Alphaproteobacteria bacterium]|nr:MAG: hypothetical protein CM15mP114_14520 [Alphaproteobacteria bacterium]
MVIHSQAVYSGVFANANVGTGKTVNITSSYSGADVNNYSVTDQSSTTADISAKALTATALHQIRHMTEEQQLQQH